jgi:uncharacterized protein (UPF0248 family)
MDQNKSIEADVSVPTLQEASKTAVSEEKDNTNAEGATTRATFKKKKGSNPKEVRRQFLQHTMGASGSGSGSGSSTTNSSLSGKLRPAKDVLQRLKYDPEYNVADYVVGCIDRKAGILEKKVENWKSFDEEELIAYFKDVKSNEIVWDRARKIDLIFGKDES